MRRDVIQTLHVVPNADRLIASARPEAADAHPARRQHTTPHGKLAAPSFIVPGSKNFIGETTHTPDVPAHPECAYLDD
ncbi:hypothetical protein LG3211_1812 [Lysobacter gummosus]|nr:hypothetical protein LG3211_1812 [Lysobacter gummosus]